ncbi:hypothetical protein V8G54_005994 [Vigna mungo]|uniref:Uncharacterized protein n=1 Tax=Vigna mungo TaxID=3915 RepID=A0AAQ3P139_VIGMU
MAMLPTKRFLLLALLLLCFLSIKAKGDLTFLCFYKLYLHIYFSGSKFIFILFLIFLKKLLILIPTADVVPFNGKISTIINTGYPELSFKKKRKIRTTLISIYWSKNMFYSSNQLSIQLLCV